MEINDGKVILDEDEAVLFGGLLQGMLQGMNARIDGGGYLSKGEREISEMAQGIVQKLEENEII